MRSIIDDNWTVEESFHCLNLLYNNIVISKNHAIYLLQANVIEEWHELNVYLSKFIKEASVDNVEDILRLIKYQEEYSSLRNKFNEIFIDQLKEFNSLFGDIAKFSTEEEIDRYVEGYLKLYYDFIDNDTQNSIQQFFEKVYDPTFISTSGDTVVIDEWILAHGTNGWFGKDLMHEKLKLVYDVWSKITLYSEYHIKPIVDSPKDFYVLLERNTKEYCRINAKYAYASLSRDVQVYKTARHLPITSKEWGMVMEKEDELFKYAIDGTLVDNPDKYEKVFDDETCKKMQSNSRLMQKILDISTDSRLFDFSYAAERHINLISALSPDNIELFYEMILRRNIVQCGMFPELKKEFEEWMNSENDDTSLSDSDQKLLKKLCSFIDRGNWQYPATNQNVRTFITELFKIRDFRDFFKVGNGGQSGREIISMANIIGYLKNYSLLTEQPKKLSKTFFGHDDQVNNINKGMNQDGNSKYKELLPLLDEYREKYIK